MENKNNNNNSISNKISPINLTETSIDNNLDRNLLNKKNKKNPI